MLLFAEALVEEKCRAEAELLLFIRWPAFLTSSSWGDFHTLLASTKAGGGGGDAAGGILDHGVPGAHTLHISLSPAKISVNCSCQRYRKQAMMQLKA